MGIIDIFRIFHPNAEEYTFFSSKLGTFAKIGHILGHKSSLSKLKKIEILSSIFLNINLFILMEANIVLVLPYINMNPPQGYRCSPSWTPLPPPSTFSTHNAMRLNINCRKKTVKNTKTWKLKNTFLNNKNVTEEIKREI